MEDHTVHRLSLAKHATEDTSPDSSDTNKGGSSESESNESGSDTPTQKPPKKPRDSVTQRALSKQKKREKHQNEVTRIAKSLWKLHECKDSGPAGCTNFGHMCFILPEKKTHHKINQTNQREWAAAIANGHKKVNLEVPPLSWITEFKEGKDVPDRKRTSGKAKDPPIPQNAPINTPAPESGPHQQYPNGPGGLPAYPAWGGYGGYRGYNQYWNGQPQYPMAPATPWPQQEYVPGPSTAPNGHILPRRRPVEAQEPRDPLPSSPMAPAYAAASTTLEAFKNYLLSCEGGDRLRQRQVEKIVEYLKENMYDLEAFKVMGVEDLQLMINSDIKLGMIRLAQRGVSVFKARHKQELESAQTLLSLDNKRRRGTPTPASSFRPVHSGVSRQVLRQELSHEEEGYTGDDYFDEAIQDISDDLYEA